MILRGVPASGKTTYAMRKQEEGYMRINRDDIRFGLFGAYWDVDEEAVTAVEDGLLRLYLGREDPVVLDATNLNRRALVQKLNIAAEFGAEVKYRNFQVSQETAIYRDSTRERSVGAEVIRGFFSRYRLDPNTGVLPSPPEPLPLFLPHVPDESLPKAYIVDTDGTVALMTGRSPYDTSRYHEDVPNPAVVTVVQALREMRSITIIGVSGRDSEFRDVTLDWWDKHVGMTPEYFFMRAQGDQRNDALVKYELFDQHIRGKFNVLGVLDDRPRVLRMWRAIDIPTLQVGNGKEF